MFDGVYVYTYMFQYSSIVMHEETHSSSELYRLMCISVSRVKLILNLCILPNIMSKTFWYTKQTFLPFMINTISSNLKANLGNWNTSKRNISINTNKGFLKRWLNRVKICLSFQLDHFNFFFRELLKKYKIIYTKAMEPHADNQHKSLWSHPEFKLCIWRTQLFQTICILRVILHNPFVL